MLISNALVALSAFSLASAAAIPEANIEERAARTVDAGFKAKGKRFVKSSFVFVADTDNNCEDTGVPPAIRELFPTASSTIWQRPISDRSLPRIQ